jgi:predicted transcriptional regulator
MGILRKTQPRVALPVKKLRTASSRCTSRLDPDMPEAIAIASVSPKDMVAILTENRRRLVMEVMKRPMTLGELAVSLQRDRTGVTKDVKLLERIGLVRTRREPNPGHGVRTVVRAAARRIDITATLEG